MNSLLWTVSELGGKKPLVPQVGRSLDFTCLEVDDVVQWEQESNVREGRVEGERFLNLCDD